MTADGFFRTGDVGYMDEDGFVFIVDRTKDMLLCGGFNVYPRNIEEAIYQHPAVEEVERHRHSRRLSRPVAEGLRQAEGRRRGFTLDEMKAFLKDRLGKHEMMQALEIRAELPKTPVGKPFKTALYEEEERKRAV